MRGKNQLVFFSVVLLFTVVLFSACEKKVEEVKEKAKEEVKSATEEIKSKAKDIAEAKVEFSVPDLKGTWTGKFDNRKTKLVITEQNGNAFKGEITINYRNVIKQKVEGSVNPKTKKIKMKDLLHSRYQGTYEGTLSADSKKFEGTFTMKVDGKKFGFSLTKQ